jgi:diguanylate cyclase (GGDEF)-like protein
MANNLKRPPIQLKRNYISRISLKIIGLVSTAVLCILTAMIVYVESTTYHSEFQQLRQTQSLITQAQATLLSDQHAEGYEESIFLTISGMLANPFIVGAKLEYYDGSEPYSIGVFKSQNISAYPVQYFSDSNNELIYVGQLSTYASDSQLKEAQTLRLIYGISTAVAVLLASILVLSTTVHRYVGLPLFKVTKAISESSSDRYVPIEWNSNDEMGTVIERLNFLHLQQHKQLSGLQQELGAKERIEAARIRHLALHDGLTNLPNRSYFMERLKEAILRSDQPDNTMAIMYVDLDHFKKINDTRGHAAGDQLLIDIAKVIQLNIAQTDLAARLGGDEFAVIFERRSDKFNDAEQLAENLLNGVLRIRDVHNLRSEFGASIGIAVHPGESIDSRDLLARADLALYHAKNTGRHCYQVYTDSLDNDARRHNCIVEQLGPAMKNNGLQLCYQPLIDSSSESVVAVEAFLRWHNVELGALSSREIIAAAEKDGMINELGVWVLTTACTEAAQWDQPLRVAVNISPSELSNDELPSTIERILAQTGLAPERLELEITEQAIVQANNKIGDILHSLKALGISLVMDDFGSGYSSLSLLKMFPIDRIKIDRSFVSADEPDETDDMIASAVIDIGHRLNLTVVAEGIETEAQLKRMQDQHCTELQGFFIGKPMLPEELKQYLNKQKNHIRYAA